MKQSRIVHSVPKRMEYLYFCAVFLLIILGFAAVIFMGQILTRTKYNEIRLHMDLVVDNIQTRIEEAKHIVEITALYPDVSDHNIALAERYLSSIVDTNPDMWSHFLITDTNGMEIVHTVGSQYYGTSLLSRDYYYVAWNEQRTVVSQPIYSVSTGRKIIAIGVPTQSNGIPNGVLCGFIHLNYLSEVLNNNLLPDHTYIFMVNRDGTISAHPNPAYILTKHLSDFTDNSVLLNEVMDLQEGIQIAKVDGHWSLTAYTPLPEYELSFVMVVPLADAFITVFSVVFLFLIVISALIVLVLFYVRIRRSTAYGKAMETTAVTDQLTGIKNRHYLEEISLEHICDDMLTVLFFDIDDFKKYNDLHDHAYGDAVLRFVGQTMVSSTRPNTDICIRYAGDEFLILFRDTPVIHVETVARRLSAALAQYQTICGAEPIFISCGISSGSPKEYSLVDLIAYADHAAYEAKRTGKNKVVISKQRSPSS